MPTPATPVVTDVVFDLGNVLVTWDRRWLYERLIDDPLELDRFLDEVLTLEFNARMDMGVPFGQAITELQALHPDHAALIKAYEERWEETLGPVIEETAELLDRLVARGIPTYALTNWSAETFERARPRLTFLHRFQGIVVSGQVGMIKPDPAIFRHLCDQFLLTPERTLFIDDNEANIATARSLGFHTELFTTPGALEQTLLRLGLLP